LIYTVTLNPAQDIFIDAPDFRPGTVNLASGLRRVWGGKGLNVARTLLSLGTPCVAMGIACGSTGDGLVAGLKESGIPSDFVRAEGETRTNIKITDSTTGETTDVNQPGPMVSTSALDELYARLASRVRAGDTVALCGSLPKGVSDGVYGDWIRKLKALGATIALDTSKTALKQGLSAAPDVAKPNIHELSELAGREINTANHALSECKKLVSSGIRLVALSLGEAGALFVRENEHVFVPGLKVQVFSTTGAGDALLAGLLSALERKDDLKNAAAFAVAVSACHVSSPPGTPLQPKRIEQLFDRAKEITALSRLESAF
jgi:1-phosphofructokinase